MNDEKGKNWETLTTKQVYDNPWISVEHHDVITPTGKPGIYGKVKFKNLAIGIIPIDDHGNTWIVGQYRYTLGTYSWEIPMGGGPHADDPLASAKRELKEETGISANSWTKLMTIHTSNCVTDELGYIYVASDLSFGATSFDDTEDLQIKKLPFSEVVEMVMNGVITDAISIAGILKYARLLNAAKS